MILFVMIILICSYLYFKYDKLDKNFYYLTEVEPKLYLLEDNYKVIQKELQSAQVRWLQWPETYLYDENNWSVIPLYAFKKWIPKYKPFFPITLNIISKIPRVKTILFSRLKANTIIDPHQGWASLSNHILRCHLPLQVSHTGTNFIAVGNEKTYHQVGKVIVFDDSKLHYSVNKSPGERIVLIVDIERPSFIEEGKSQVQETPELMGLLDKI